MTLTTYRHTIRMYSGYLIPSCGALRHMWPCNGSGADFTGLVFAERHRGHHVASQPVLKLDKHHLVSSGAGRIVARALDGTLVPRLDALVAVGGAERGIYDVADFETAREDLRGRVSHLSDQRTKKSWSLQWLGCVGWGQCDGINVDII